MSPLILVTVAIVAVAVPLAPFAAAFLWSLYREERATSSDPRIVTLAAVLASVVTAGTVAVVLVAIPVLFFVLGAPPEVQRAGGSLVLIALDILLVILIAPAAYLRFVRRRSYS